MVGETPFGPWEDAGKVEEGFDLQIFKDPTTGKVYGFSSDPQSRPRAVEFNNDPASQGYLRETKKEESIEGPFFDYTEGSFVHYRNGKYYLMYSGGKCGDVTYNIRYAVSDNVWGPYQDAPNNPILEKNKEQHVYGPGHHSVFEVDGQTYIAYHRQDFYNYPTCSQRQICIDKLEFDDNGRIKKVIPTHKGVDVGLSGDKKRANIAFGKPVTSSGNAKGFEPEFAVDENFATRWMTGRNSGTFAVDLEQVYEISEIQPWFVYYDYFNLFKIEYSLDNQQWETYVDRTTKAEKAWKPIENKTVEARYVKISIIRGGPNAAALFELKVFGEPVN
jgi:beta-xylosidase